MMLNMLLKAIKGQAVVDFLTAHPISESSPFTTDLPDEEVITDNSSERTEMFFGRPSKSPTGVRKEDAAG